MDEFFENFEAIIPALLLDPLMEAWQKMYPAAVGPWEPTDEKCDAYPNCICDGNVLKRKIYESAWN